MVVSRMSAREEFSFSVADFCGTSRLFPLPNLVMFPHVQQPLHVFEARYREMVEDALAGDRLIAMALLAPGWEVDYEGRPPLCSTACLGRIAAYHRLEGGRYNLLLQGLCRARITSELPAERSFRQAELELLEDVYPSAGAGERPSLRRQLIRHFRELLPEGSLAHAPLDELLKGELPLGMLTDIFAYTIDLDGKTKEYLLGEVDVDQRAAALIEHLERLCGQQQEAAASKFPPEFSIN